MHAIFKDNLRKKMATYIVVKLNCFQGVPEKLFIKKSFLVTNAVVYLTTDFKMEEKTAFDQSDHISVYT